MLAFSKTNWEAKYLGEKPIYTLVTQQQPSNLFFSSVFDFSLH